MKQKYNILYGLLALCLLTGCSDADLPEAGAPDISGGVTLPLGIEGVALDAEMGATTRATTKTLTTGSIGIFLAGNGYTAINNRQYDYAVPAWTPNGGTTNTIYLGPKADVCAYHPWTSGYTNSAAIPLTSAVYTEAKDISYATDREMQGNEAGCKTSFTMIRAYAKAIIKVKRENYPGTCTVSKLEIRNLLPAATLNITDGTYSTAAGTTATVISETRNVTVPVTGTADWGTYLFVPCTPYGTGMVISLTVDGKLMTTTVAAANYKPVAGECNTITVSLKGTGLKVTSVTTTDWNTGDIGNIDSEFD